MTGQILETALRVGNHVWTFEALDAISKGSGVGSEIELRTAVRCPETQPVVVDDHQREEIVGRESKLDPVHAAADQPIRKIGLDDPFLLARG